MNTAERRQKRVNIACATRYAMSRANREKWPMAVCHEPGGVKVWVILALRKLPEGSEFLVLVSPEEPMEFELPEDSL